MWQTRGRLAAQGLAAVELAASKRGFRSFLTHYPTVYGPGCVKTAEAPRPRERLSEIAQNRRAEIAIALIVIQGEISSINFPCRRVFAQPRPIAVIEGKPPFAGVSIRFGIQPPPESPADRSLEAAGRADRVAWGAVRVPWPCDRSIVIAKIKSCSGKNKS
jgi:hypothetical protein